MTRAAIAGLAALVVAVVFLVATLFTVGQTDQALVTEFGKPVRVVEKAGLHARIPFVQSVIEFDRRLLMARAPSEEVILGDQRRLIVDSFTMYRISDPLKFYQAAGASEEAITGRLSAIVSSAIRRVLGTRSLPDVLSADRDHIISGLESQLDSLDASLGEESDKLAVAQQEKVRLWSRMYMFSSRFH